MAKHKNQKVIKNLSEGPYQTKVRQNSFTKAIQEIHQEEQVNKKENIRRPRKNKNNGNQKEENIRKLLKKLKGKTSY